MTAVRPPLQQRSRDSWRRALAAGIALLESGGVEALTVTGVCRRAQLTPPSLYARVDGRAGLFAAVYEHGMTAVRATEAELLDGVREGDTRAVVAVLAGVFERHRALFRAVAVGAASDVDLRAHGAAESQRFLAVLAPLLPGPAERAAAVLRTLYAECVLRLLWGDAFVTATSEGDAAFHARLTELAERLLGDRTV